MAFGVREAASIVAADVDAEILSTAAVTGADKERRCRR